MTADQLMAAMGCTRQKAILFADPLSDAAARWGIYSPQALACWLGQIAVECAKLESLVENLNYTAQGLANTWPTRFQEIVPGSGGRQTLRPTALAYQLARNPEAIANHVYAGRYGNGPVGSGDGWLFRGRGCGHTTFRSNYRSTGVALGLPLERMPEYLEIPEHAASSAAYFFSVTIPPEVADAVDARRVSMLWNGGSNGMVERVTATKRALEVFL